MPVDDNDGSPRTATGLETVRALAGSGSKASSRQTLASWAKGRSMIRIRTANLRASIRTLRRARMAWRLFMACRQVRATPSTPHAEVQTGSDLFKTLEVSAKRGIRWVSYGFVQTLKSSEG
ncbi:MAG: hypothetical protein C0485_01785 [Pirellula sp.]|nr:hypothetical protein [Pirellula sp.]